MRQIPWWAMRRTQAALLGLSACAIVGPALVPKMPGLAWGTTTARGAHFTICNGGGVRNCVVDGDTLWHDGVKIRLADIDAPETFQAKCASELALGNRAKLELLSFVNAGSFQLVRAGWRDEDQYGRKLRLLKRNGRSAGDVLVSKGLARKWDGSRKSWC